VEEIALTHKPIVYDPPPDPPAIVVSTSVFLAAAGILHLVFAALSDMPEVLHQVLAVLEILIAAGIAITALNWRKEYDKWVAEHGSPSTEQTPTEGG
jgi:hypothetical protein